MAGSYRVFIKEGDYGYRDSDKQYGVIDLNVKFDDLAAALREFLDHVDALILDTEDGVEDGGKVSLTFQIKKAKKVKK